VHPEDERLGRLIRLMRLQAGQTQVELSQAAHVPLRDLKRLEAGRAGDVRLGRIRDVIGAMAGRARLAAWWNGAAADQLLDARHARLTERGVVYLASYRWTPHVEVSFSEFGEHGSIDILAVHETALAVAVCEVKSALGSLEETNRILDMKERLAPTLVYKRFGWRPRVVGRILIVPRDSSIRRVIEAHPATMDQVYPARGRDVRAWLRSPATPLRAIWFVSDGPTTSRDSR
jgi:hypothetical protein